MNVSLMKKLDASFGQIAALIIPLPADKCNWGLQLGSKLTS